MERAIVDVSQSPRYFGRLENKVFILGIGAQKAATTWLYRYLAAQPDVFMSPIKELHYFDMLWCPDLAVDPPSFDNRFINRLKTLVEAIPSDAEKIDRATMTKLKTIVDRIDAISGGTRAYADFFLRRVRPMHTHFGEITPSYAILPIEGFRQIEAMHPDVRIVFLMRDPVDRLASAANMVERKRRDSFETIESLLAEKAFVERTRYDKTIKKLRAVFAPDKIFFGFYETLFCEESIKALCAFLGLRYTGADFDQRYNQADNAWALSEADAETARRVFAPVYDFCRGEFGERVPASWRA